jgi:hypothetical protein
LLTRKRAQISAAVPASTLTSCVLLTTESIPRKDATAPFGHGSVSDDLQ